MIKRIISKLKMRKAKRNKFKRESWNTIMFKHMDLTDAEFIDELVNKYHPPKRKVK